MASKLLYGWLAMMTIVSLASCYEEQDGCLDLLAANYNAAADKECEGCCTYPSLRVSLVNQWNDRNFILNDTFTNLQGQSFIILQQKFFLAGIGMADEKSSPIPFELLTSYTWLDGKEAEVANNFKLISGTLAEVVINTFRKEGGVTSFEYGVGPDVKFNGLDTLALANTSDFTPAAGMLTKDNKYLAYKAKIVAGPSLKDTLDVAFEGEWRFSNVLNPQATLVPGKDIKFIIRIQYHNLFDQVPFANADPIAIGEAIRNNVEAAFKQ
ncbi:MAG: hypothetical protein IPH94_20580 [Saprospiraceae bacterium]|nr:hypothetical protein [Saprospiraceae bacterium]MBK7787754.1 hypothetical protein [Saprospiraceae bacterium]MBK8109190.1 hypothetical protein [Saprospiraceae bacterium]MBK9687725.1 hypothetical protein [Saprospiraceae bacterium]